MSNKNKHAEINYDKIEENKEYEDIILNVVDECFKNEGLDDLKLYISINLVTPDIIKEANKKYRNIDRETDVLSFPMFEKSEIEELKHNKQDKDIDFVLGDLIISIPRVYEQAEEYGHSFKRELSYMVVHGFYHLMGYDHIKEEDKKEMRKKEDEILNKLHITRD